MYSTPSLPSADGAIGTSFKSYDETGTAGYNLDRIYSRVSSAALTQDELGGETVLLQTIFQLTCRALVFSKSHCRSSERLSFIYTISLCFITPFAATTSIELEKVCHRFPKNRHTTKHFFIIQIYFHISQGNLTISFMSSCKMGLSWYP